MWRERDDSCWQWHKLHKCLACHWQNYCFDLKMDTEIDAPSAIRGAEAHAGLTLKALFKHKLHFSPQKHHPATKPAFAQIWHRVVGRCITDRYVAVLLPPLTSTTSPLILAQCNHSRLLIATEQLGAKLLRACTSAVVFKRGESVTHSVSPTGLAQGFEPCLIDYIAFRAP